METVAYISDLLRSNMRLFSAIYDFNNGMIDYMHGDFVPGILSEKFVKPLMQSTYRGKFLEYIRQLLGIENQGWYNFSDPRYFLCLLSAEEIHRIICYIGGICFSEQIRKIIWGRELIKIKGTIGNDAYLFSIRSASLMLKAEAAESFRTEGSTLVESIFNTGKTIIEMGLAGIPQEIAQRFILKFPKNFGWEFNQRVNDPQYYFEFIKKVVKRALAESTSIAVSIIKA
ncbi:MAG: SctK family type III secretion system sorting platform protein [Puniceicoccales bacterium]|nr:SctK family type III secretion system sorting platform protein [Puniceicoccales bacterium]